MRTFGKNKRKYILSGAVALMPFAPSLAQAQCTPSGDVATIAAGLGITNYAAGLAVNSLVSAINASNTAFLTQSTAFIGAPAAPQSDQLGGGAWARGVGGEIKTKNTGTSTYAQNGAPLTGNLICNSSTKLDFAGVQVGADIARLNVNGWNLHTGATAGYLGARAQDTTPGSGTFSNNLQVPFIGLYGAATYGGFFIDGQVRWDDYQNEISDPINIGIFNQHFDARGVALSGNIGYHHDLGNNWFIEPSAGVVWSKVEVDPLNVSGTLVLGTGFLPPGTVQVSDLYSTLGRLSLRAGTNVEMGNWALQPFFTASVIHEFQGQASTTLVSIPQPGFPLINGTINTSSLGTYEQFGIGVAGQLSNTGWLGYVRGDYRTGDNIEGWSLNGGVRYQFTPELVAKSPIITKAPINKAPVLQKTYSWTGFYVGGNLGALSGRTDWTDVGTGAPANPRFAGIIGGGQFGYSYQVDKWVMGVEGDLGWTNAHGARPCPNQFFLTCEDSMSWLSTATARLGYAYWDRVLWYVKAGLAVGQVQTRFVCNTDSQPTPLGLLGCPSRSDTNRQVGWTAGWGTEFALTQSWSVKSETMYFDLGTDRYNMGGILADVHSSGFSSKLGLNYRFAGL